MIRIVFGCLILTFMTCGIANSIRKKVYESRTGDIYNGMYKDDLKEVMESNPDFNYSSASLKDIENTFGEKMLYRNSYKYPRIREFEGVKKYFDQVFLYDKGYTTIKQELPGMTYYRPMEGLRLYFYLFKGKGVSYRVRHDIKDDKDKWIEGKFNTSDISISEASHKIANQDLCDRYFYNAFSLGERRGYTASPGYHSKCDFDYDPNYWKDPIYKPIWNPKEMGTLEELGIKYEDAMKRN